MWENRNNMNKLNIPKGIYIFLIAMIVLICIGTTFIFIFFSLFMCSTDCFKGTFTPISLNIISYLLTITILTLQKYKNIQWKYGYWVILYSIFIFALNNYGEDLLSFFLPPILFCSTILLILTYIFSNKGLKKSNQV